MTHNFSRRIRQPHYPAVLVLDFRPPRGIPNNWERAAVLAEQYRSSMTVVSNGQVVYLIGQTISVPAFPVPYDETSYQAALADPSRAKRDEHGNYLMADYLQIIRDHFIQHRIEADGFDEVWMFGGPFFGFYESRMIGRGAFWCNAPALELDSRRFVMMGFNYERSVREMIHNFGHRAESILARKFNSTLYLSDLYRTPDVAPPAPKNEFEQFLFDNGTVHRAPGGPEYGQDERAWLGALDSKWWRFIVDPNTVM